MHLGEDISLAEVVLVATLVKSAAAVNVVVNMEAAQRKQMATAAAALVSKTKELQPKEA